MPTREPAQPYGLAPDHMSAGGDGSSSDAGWGCPNPPGGRPRMSLEQRAKIFVPFDPLDGFSAALRAVELEPEATDPQEAPSRF